MSDKPTGEQRECFIAGCDYAEIDTRGPIMLRDGSKHPACVEHWEAILLIVGRQGEWERDAMRADADMAQDNSERHHDATLDETIATAEGHGPCRDCSAGEPLPACRKCGCTSDAACAGGCWWVPDPDMFGDLCSSCV